MTSLRSCHLAYVVYWGATEPLGRALVLPAVEGLAREIRVTLVTFEKPADFASPGRAAAVRDRLEPAGVRWIPLVYHKRPAVMSSFADAARGVAALGRLHRQDRLDAIEGRTFVGGMIGARAAATLSLPFVYHTEGCWADEQVDVGRWAEGSIRHRIARWIDRRTLRRAGAVVVLTERAKDDFGRLGRTRAGTPIAVVPSTSGLVESSTPQALRSCRDAADGLRLIYLGSVAGKYLLGPLLDFVAAARAVAPATTLEVLAHMDHDRVLREVGARGLGAAVSVARAELDDVPRHLLARDAGLFFMAPGLSEPCVSPTKVGEYLAHGLPVACTAASGDAASLLERGHVGTVLRSLDAGSYHQAALDLIALCRDPDLPLRAHRLAREHYSLGLGVERQVELLRPLLRGPR